MAETPLDLALISAFTGGVNMPTREQATANYVPVAAVMPDGSINLTYVDPAVITPGAGAVLAAALAPLLNGQNLVVDANDNLIYVPHKRLVHLVDEFCSAEGELNWSLLGVGTPARSKVEGSVTTGVGAIRIDTSSSTNDTAVLSGANFFGQYCTKCAWWLDLNASLTDVKYEVGFGRTPSSAAFGDSGVFFRFDASVDAKWRAVTRDATVETVTDTGVTYNAPQNQLELVMEQVTAGTVVFSINGSVVATHSTNVPAGGSNFQTFGARLETLTTAAKRSRIDRFEGFLEYPGNNRYEGP